jgi:hypothetical protein
MRFVPWAALALVVPSVMACDSADVPLGGPYGGTATAPPPGPENLQGGGEAGTSSSLDGAVDGLAVEGAASDGVAVTPTDGGDGGVGAAAPTWNTIFSSYFTMCKTCHVEMTTASSAYSWLVSQGFIDGAFSPLVSPAQSCLTWYGGDMPPGGTSNPAAVAAMNAWAAAGALDPDLSDQ